MTARSNNSADQAGTTAERPAFLAHHFDTPQQQFSAGKLGMWIFLLTEILFFGGLFCVYAVYRANHPAVFADGRRILETPLGAANTVVLIFSSLTMALAVYSAQCDRRGRLVFFLAVTLVCAFGFLGIKLVEYKKKWDHRLVPGQERIEYVCNADYLKAAAKGLFSRKTAPQLPVKQFKPDEHYVAETFFGRDAADVPKEELARRTRDIRSFVGIYFALTGLHAIHVLAGIVVISWILVRAAKGHFGRDYFTPVDLTALYWHLVDMIWIYLFPLLYLIR